MSEAHPVDDVIRSRRTNMFVDRSRLVPDEIIAQLCELATWAPNHKRTWPWRFASLTGSARSRFGEVVSAAMAANGDDESKVVKARTKYERTPNVLVIGSVRGDSDERTAENRYAVAAGIQNFLLGAHAHGLAALWGSPMRGANAAINDVCGFANDTEILGLIYLGWPTGNVEVPERPAPSVNWL